MVQQNHIFSCTPAEDQVGRSLLVNLCESNLPEHKVVTHNSIKRDFHRNQKYPTKDAVIANRRIDIKAYSREILMQIPCSGLNPYKQVEMWKKFRHIVPPEHQSDPLYDRPSKTIFENVEGEKKKRKTFKGEINAKKLDAQRKANILAKVEAEAKGLD